MKSFNCLFKLTLVALLISAVHFRAYAQWIETKNAHYSVFYEAGYEKDADFASIWLLLHDVS